MSIIDRYLIREVLQTLLATMLVLLAVVLSFRFARFLTGAATGLLAADAIWVMLVMLAIRFSAILLPLSFLLALMLAFGRLYRDSEMTALMACGVGPISIYRPLLVIAIPLALLLAGLSFAIVPQSIGMYNEVRDQAQREAELFVFTPGRFRELAGGAHAVYVNGLSEDGRELQQVFIHSRLAEGVAITTAESGKQEVDEADGTRYMMLENGYRYQGIPGEKSHRNLHFDRLKLRLDVPETNERRQRISSVPSIDLLADPDLQNRAELHSRLGGPVSLILLALLAPVLARSNPREGRYGRVVLAVLVYAVYFNFLGVGQAWIERGVMPEGLGLWWVHGSMLAFTVLLWRFGSRFR